VLQFYVRHNPIGAAGAAELAKALAANSTLTWVRARARRSTHRPHLPCALRAACVTVSADAALHIEDTRRRYSSGCTGQGASRVPYLMGTIVPSTKCSSPFGDFGFFFLHTLSRPPPVVQCGFQRSHLAFARDLRVHRVDMQFAEAVAGHFAPFPSQSEKKMHTFEPMEGEFN